MSYDAEGNYIDDGASISMADEAAAGNAQMDRFNENPNAANQYEAWVDSESAKAGKGLDMGQQARLDYAQTQTPQGQAAEKRADEFDSSNANYDKTYEAFNTIKEYSGMMNNMLGLSKSVMTGGGEAKTGGEDTGFMSKLMDGILNPKNAEITKIGAGIIAGMFNYKSKNAAANAATKSAEASMMNAESARMNAQTAQEAQNLQTAGSKAMGLIHMPQAPIKYQNLLAERRARSGAK